MTSLERKDPLTGEFFLAKRRNQIFAVNKNRIDFHNQKAALIRDEKRKLDSSLRKNFLILKEIVGDNKEAIFHRMFLLGKGFSFTVATHASEFNGQPQWSIYTYLWMPLPDDQIKIIRP